MLPYPMLTAEEAAELVRDGETLAFGGFTAAGTPTAVSKALAGKHPYWQNR
jgi:acyl-CoA hydrolase